MTWEERPSPQQGQRPTQQRRVKSQERSTPQSVTAAGPFLGGGCTLSASQGSAWAGGAEEDYMWAAAGWGSRPGAIIYLTSLSLLFLGTPG